MPQIELPQGTISYRVVGPEDSRLAPVVFIHGLLVDGRLWNGVADRLAAQGLRCYQPDLPLGSHRIPMPPATDLSPAGLAGLIDAFMAGMGLDDVTLVGNDTGGALCQFTIDTHPERVGRLVLTNCDAFDKFPPAPFDGLVRAARHPAVTRALLLPMGSRLVRHSPLGFGLLAREFDAGLTRDWLAPAMRDAAIREDIARFARAVKPAELLDVSTRLHRFERPVRVVWGEADRVFKPAFGRRLADLFEDGTYVGLPGARTFVALDEPDGLAERILEIGAPEAAREPEPSPPAAR
jgi:pimeloyl-ACP methyl ester carboxylesterase